MTQAGYSGTPLAKKLGIKEGIRVYVRNAPDDYFDWISPVPEDVTFLKRRTNKIDLAHIFVSKVNELGRVLSDLYDPIDPDGMIWISWHKKASRVSTEITEDVIRDVALPMGLIDVKVCAVSEVFSGLKLVIKKELRSR